MRHSVGEVSIRVKDLNAMHKFYKEVVGLEVLRRDEGFVFFKVAEGYGGHTQNLALFDATNRYSSTCCYGCKIEQGVKP